MVEHRSDPARMPADRCAPPVRAVRRLRWLGPLSLALLAPAAGAVAFAPGHAEPDPPTGDSAAAAGERSAERAAEPLRAPGFRWVVGPWRSGGSVSAGLRWLRLGEGQTGRQATLGTEMEWASHLWQPWFLQLRFGLGLVGTRDSSQGGDSGTIRGNGTGSTAHLDLSLFPASRFPFELRAELGDNRSSGDTLGSTVRHQRLALSQSWRPEQGHASLHLNLDHSRLMADTGDDILTSLTLTGQTQQGAHSLDAAAQLVRNHRTDLDDRQTLHSLNARHGFQPRPDLQVDTLANWSESRLHGGRGLDGDRGNGLAQVSTVLNWRPQDGDPLFNPDRPLQLAATLRWSELGVSEGGRWQRAQAWSATTGASIELPPAWRLAVGVATSQLQAAGVSTTTSHADATVGWNPGGTRWGPWRYLPNANANASLAAGSNSPARRLIGVQGSHGLSRDWALDGGGQLALNLTQSAAVVRESSVAQPVLGLAHGLGLFWQGSGDGSAQRFASLSLNDSRSRAAASGQFQMANLQWSQRSQIDRYNAWSVNLTLQASRNQSTDIDPFTGERRSQASGWQHFFSGGASLDQQRVFGIPRLRHTLQLTLNSQQLERRALGDVDAPRERITQSLESRLDYSIGRLELRLSARHARVEGHSVATVQARLLRRF